VGEPTLNGLRWHPGCRGCRRGFGVLLFPHATDEGARASLQWGASAMTETLATQAWHAAGMPTVGGAQ